MRVFCINNSNLDRKQYMAVKVTMVSSDPSMKPFEEWFNDKINQFELAGDLASVDKFHAAQTAKNEAVKAQNGTAQVLEDGSVLLSHSVYVPEFDEIFSQWLAEYKVVLVDEEV